jgi:hypothetical protein
VAIGTRLPGVEVTTSYGTPSLKAAGGFMCRLRTDPDALVLRVVDLGEREALLQGQPDAFFTTPHYDGHPSVLVRLEVVDPQELAELLEEAWRLRAKHVPAYDAERWEAGGGRGRAAPATLRHS